MVNPQAKSVYVLYGFCEGPNIGKKFTDSILAAGFSLAKDARSADTIIGHSGGCFVIPDSAKAKLVILIGLPIWPGKSLVRSIGQKVFDDFTLHRKQRRVGEWLNKSIWNGIYLWKIKNNWQMFNNRNKMPNCKEDNLTIIIRNRDDTACTPDIYDILSLVNQTFLSLAGPHDDCWINPDTYIDIIKSATKLYELA